MMRAIFLPVWSTGVLDRLHLAIPRTHNNWFDSPPLIYPQGMFSYADWRRYGKRLAFPVGSYTFGDSGGFTLIGNPREKFNPAEVLRWQAAHMNVGAILDRPPRGSALRDWRGCLDFTVWNVRRTLPAYLRELENGGTFRWWGVLHGNTDEEADEWYSAVAAVYPFSDEGEGWGVYPGPKANPLTVARTMRFLRTVGIRRAHFFACTGQDVVATILALGPKAGLEVVTFDSMSHAVAGINRWWCMTRPNCDCVYTKVRCLDDLPEKLCRGCPCRVCELMREHMPEQPDDPANGWRDAAITLHNLEMQRTCIERQESWALSDHEGFLQAVLGPVVAARTFRIFDSPSAVRRTTNVGLLARLKATASR